MSSKPFVSVALPTLIYVVPDCREDFEQIEVDASVHPWQFSETTTLLKGDGQRWERRCNAKWVEQGSVKVIFQWWDERVEVRERQVRKFLVNHGVQSQYVRVLSDTEHEGRALLQAHYPDVKSITTLSGNHTAPDFTVAEGGVQ